MDKKETNLLIKLVESNINLTKEIKNLTEQLKRTNLINANRMIKEAKTRTIEE